MIQQVLRLLIGLTISAAIVGCRSADPPRSVLFLGCRSQPEADTLQEGDVLSITTGDTLAVFGRGDLGTDPWGVAHLSWDSGTPVTFRKGGVVSWAPEGARALRLDGVADVPLVAILLDAEVDDSLNPSSMTIRRLWQIEEGTFAIEAN